MKMTNDWDHTSYTGDGTYATCERTYVVLAIYHDLGSHEDITGILGLRPTRASSRSGKWKTSSGEILDHKHTMWLFETEGLCNSLDIRDHLELLLSRLDERIKAVQKLKGVRMGVHCIWWSKGEGGPCMASSQMKRLGELGLECSFDISFFGEDDE